MRHLSTILAAGAATAFVLPKGGAHPSHKVEAVAIDGLDAANYGEYGNYGSYGTYDNYGPIVGGEPLPEPVSPVSPDVSPTATVVVTFSLAGFVSTATTTTTVANLTVDIGTAPTAATTTITVANHTVTATRFPDLVTGTAATPAGTGIWNATAAPPAGATPAGNSSLSVVTVTVNPKTVYFGNATTSTVTVTAPSSKTVVVRLARVQ